MAIYMENSSLSGTLTAGPRFRAKFILLSRLASAATDGIGAPAPLEVITFLEYLFTVDFEVKELGVFSAIVYKPPPTSVKRMK